MKCIRCQHDSKYKDRGDRRCPQCRKEFAFEPQKGDLLTDAAFQSAIDAVSAQGRVRWGVEHLYYEVCRRRRNRPGSLRGYLAFLGFVAGTVAGVVLLAGRAPGPVPVVGGILLGVVVAVVAGIGTTFLVNRVRWRPRTVVVARGQFDEMWARWGKVHAAPKGVIVRKTGAPTRRAAEPDLADYSFDRAVICDRARTADLLIANNFHFENNCAVLAIGGYPPGPFETVRAMLQKNPRLQVFALHNATAPGCRLAHRLATSPEWFQHLGRVTDVGLRPRHARPFDGLLLASEGDAFTPGDGLSAEEAAWLSRFSLELAAIRPEQVLKRLFRAINGTPDRDVEGEGTSGSRGNGSAAYDEASFADNAGDSDGGADSFG
jgi:hypothetical protein